MLLHEYFSKRLLAVFASKNLHFFFLNLISILLVFLDCLLLDSLDCCSEIFRSCLPVIRCLLKNFVSLTSCFLLLFLLLLLDNCGLLFVNQSLGFRVEFLSLAHEYQFASFSMLLQSFSIEFTTAAFRAFNKISFSRHWFFNFFLFYRFLFIKYYRFFRLRFVSLLNRLRCRLLNRFFNLFCSLSVFSNHDSFLSGFHRIRFNRNSSLFLHRAIIEDQLELFFFCSTDG